MDAGRSVTITIYEPRDYQPKQQIAMQLQQRLLAEFVGAALLTGVVVGSGIMADRLAGGSVGLALLGNTLATGAILFVLIAVLGPISGAHFNPAVTLVMALRCNLPWGEAGLYVGAQVLGCLAGVALAHAMFELPVLQVATTERSGPGQMLSEGVATATLVLAILGALRWRPDLAAPIVALTIVAGYWWTASTSFANPAITIGRGLSNTFAGVAPVDVPGFILAQLVGAIVALGLAMILYPPEKP